MSQQKGLSHGMTSMRTRRSRAPRSRKALFHRPRRASVLAWVRYRHLITTLSAPWVQNGMGVSLLTLTASKHGQIPPRSLEASTHAGVGDGTLVGRSVHVYGHCTMYGTCKVDTSCNRIILRTTQEQQNPYIFCVLFSFLSILFT